MPKLSVIVPIFGVEKFIERCARSLFEQTLDDIEYIFINDETPDKSMEILDRVINEYPLRKDSILIKHNEKNYGQAKTRVEAIKHATGNYIIHCDSDDWVEPQMYKTLYDKALNENLDIVWCDFYKVNGHVRQKESQQGINDNIEAIKDILLGRRMGTLWNHLIRRDIVKNYCYLEPKSNLMEDVVLLIQYYYYSKRIGYINQPLYNYYHNDKSTSRDNVREKMIWQVEEMGKNLQVINEFFLNEKIESSMRNYIEYRKYFNKRWILPIVNKTEDCKLWIKIHPEINFSLFFNPLLSIYDKRTSLLVLLHIYPLLKRMIKGGK